ncbi:adhesion G protein-coupled receptor L4-like [Dysidea avara]|uniref:adhesion G protein-coupled receptor L4-like n=1 Tax=Dysidea avara TaxID=196820 RepID=UPI003333D21B
MRVWLYAILFSQVIRSALLQSGREVDDYDCNCVCQAEAVAGVLWAPTCVRAYIERDCFQTNDTTMSSMVFERDCVRDHGSTSCTWAPDNVTIVTQVRCPTGQSVAAARELASMIDDVDEITADTLRALTNFTMIGRSKNDVILVAELFGTISFAIDRELTGEFFNVFFELLEALLATEYQTVFDEDEKLYYMDRIFDATEKFLFDHLNPNDEDMYDGDYFEFELFDYEELNDSDSIFLSHGELGSVQLPREAVCSLTLGRSRRALSKAFKRSITNLLPGNLSSTDGKFRNRTTYRLMSPVISGSISCCDAQCRDALNTVGAKITISHTRKIRENEIPLCVFWNQTRSSREINSFWSTAGCDTTSYNSTHTNCVCYHLTHFAILFGSRSLQQETGLHYISYIGCGISIVCLLLAIATFVILRNRLLKSKHNLIHLNLSIALLLGLILFVSGAENAKNSEEGCIVVTTFLHYFFLAVFCWMLCEGIIILFMLLAVFYKGLFQEMYFFMFLGWGLPVPIVAVSAGLSYKRYGIEDDDGSITVCWVSDEDGAIWAFTSPVILIIVINIIVMIISLVKVYQTRRVQDKRTNTNDARYETAKTLLLSTMALLPLLGVTWIMGLLFLIDDEQTSVPLAWIFTIVNSLQGAAIFFFHVVRNKEVKGGLQEKIEQWRKSRRMKSSLKEYTMKSMKESRRMSKRNTLVAIAEELPNVQSDDQATLPDKDVLQNTTI